MNLAANSETQEYLPQRPSSSQYPSQPPAPASPVKASYPSSHPPYVPEMTPGPPSPVKTVSTLLPTFHKAWKKFSLLKGINQQHRSWRIGQIPG